MTAKKKFQNIIDMDTNRVRSLGALNKFFDQVLNQIITAFDKKELDNETATRLSNELIEEVNKQVEVLK